MSKLSVVHSVGLEDMLCGSVRNAPCNPQDCTRQVPLLIVPGKNTVVYCNFHSRQSFLTGGIEPVSLASPASAGDSHKLGFQAALCHSVMSSSYASDGL